MRANYRIVTNMHKRCGFTVIGEYIDRAMTGTNDNREDFQRMIRDAAKKQFEFIIVYKLGPFCTESVRQCNL